MISSKNLHNHTGQSITAPLTAHHRLGVKWYERWHPDLDHALQCLPEMATCPHELFRLFFQEPGPVEKKLAVVSEHGDPVALAGLRKTCSQSWVPVTQWIVPGSVFPSKPGYLMPALEALGLDIWVAWWRMGDAQPQSHLMRYIEATPTYRFHFTDNFEQYWRDNDYFNAIRKVRNRCRGYTSAINLPGSAEWTIRNSERKWRENPAEADPNLPDRLLAAKYLEAQGRHFTLALLDGETLIGGCTLIAHAKDLVAAVIYRDPDHDRCGVGNRLIDLCFSFAAEQGFETFDLGGGYDYKQHWARQEGTRWSFSMCPELLFRAKQLANLVRGARGKVSNWLH